MIRRLLRLPNDDLRKIVFVAFAVCLVCSLVVSTTAVLLEPMQHAAEARYQRHTVLVDVAGLSGQGGDVDRLFARIEARMVDLETDRYTQAADPASYDPRNPGEAIPISADLDTAKLGARPRYVPVYLIREAGVLQRIILPVYGSGMYDRIYAYIALEADFNTVAAFRVYQHGETPGLGGEIASSGWLAKWPGKRIYNGAEMPRLKVVKRRGGAVGDDDVHELDGIAGATRTGRSVTNLLGYWLGPGGFGPFLAWLREGGVPDA